MLHFCVQFWFIWINGLILIFTSIQDQVFFSMQHGKKDPCLRYELMSRHWAAAVILPLPSLLLPLLPTTTTHYCHFSSQCSSGHRTWNMLPSAPAAVAAAPPLALALGQSYCYWNHCCMAGQGPKAACALYSVLYTGARATTGRELAAAGGGSHWGMQA